MNDTGVTGGDPRTSGPNGDWRSEERFLALRMTAASGATLEQAIQRKRYAPGDVLYWEGDPAHNVYWIVAGAAKCFKLLSNGRSQITRFATSGDFLAMSSFDSHDCSAEALTACHAVHIPRKVLETVADGDPLLHRQIMQVLSGELESSRRQVLLLGRMHAVERLSTFLLDFADRSAARGSGDSAVVELPMTRTDIADYLGLTIETVSRVLNKFKRDGLIAMERPTFIRLLDRARLSGCEQTLAA